jgi:hypothetical protein
MYNICIEIYFLSEHSSRSGGPRRETASRWYQTRELEAKGK